MLTLLTTLTYAQKVEDNRITVTVIDTVNIYQRTRQAIVNTNFIIREDSKKDTLLTSSERIDNTSIFVTARIVINNNLVEITGAYGLGYEDFWGFPSWPKGYKRVIYFKESEAWKVLRRIAIKLDGKISFSRDN